MRDLKIRILDDSKVEDVDLWLASGTVRVSRTALLNTLFEAFHEEITNKEPSLANTTTCIKNAIKIGHARVDAQRFGENHQH